jgi:RHS repeat-associated protein
MDRAIKSIDPAGVESLMTYDLATDVLGNLALHTQSIANQNASTQIITDAFKDIQGRTTSTSNLGPDGNLITKFNYNAIGELKSYIDAQDLETKYEYDLAGRKVFMQHPDRGILKYFYDTASNLVRLQTAKLAINDNYVTYKYNYNRLEQVTFPEQNGQANLSNVKYVYGEANSGNQTGRLIYQEDATGIQEFKYGNMGELIYNKRIIEAPNLPTRLFETYFDYDSFNRIQVLIYPDGEKLKYTYNLGGNLIKMEGQVQDHDYNYVEQIDYDHYEQRIYIKYGNQTENRYTYTPDLRRLANLTSKASTGQEMLNNTYSYDQIGNVTQLYNTASFNESNQLGGTYMHSYAYDNLNRLVGAEGSFAGFHAEVDENIANYGLSMSYNATHGIVTKKQEHSKNGTQVEDNTYKHHYSYIEGSHKVEKVEGGNVNEYFKYDANGNVEHRSTSTGENRHMLWDESDRLRVLMDHHQMHHFIYDAAGNRTLKASSHYEEVFENGQLVQDQNITLENYTTYASAYLVIDANKKYSKHYFVGNERIATQLGTKDIGSFEANTYLKNAATDDQSKKAQLQIADLKHLLKAQRIKKIRFAPYKKAVDSTTTNTTTAKTNTAKESTMAESANGIYFFHNDHLGTGTILTDGSGLPYQFFLNLPFGETFFEQHSYTEDYNNPYKFNGKELDEETGLYYYGARYYDPKVSIWLSVDPLAEEFPSWSPYAFCNNNPLYYTDPTGMSAEPPVNGLAFFSDDTGNYYWNDAKSSYEHYAYTDDSKTTTVFKDYYTANEFKEPVGDYNIIFDLSNSKPKDVYDPEKTITVIALPTLHYLDLFGNTKDISDNDKYPGVKIYSSPNMNGALTAGNVIIMDSEMVGDGETLDHEYGHYLDYKYHFNYNQGEYIDKIAIPSVKSAAGNGVHEKTSTEKRANRLGGEYGNNKALKDKYRPKK